MALKPDQIESIVALVKAGKLSNVKIAEEVGCSESAVRTTIKKYGVQKNEINELAKIEVQSIIIQNEIKTRKNELTRKERDQYNDSFLEEYDAAKALGMFNNSTVDNQMLIDQAQNEVLRYINEDRAEAKEKGRSSYAAMEQLPNLLAIGKGTEQNRKQLFGTTQPTDVNPDSEKVIFNMDFGSGEDEEE